MRSKVMKITIEHEDGSKTGVNMVLDGNLDLGDLIFAAESGTRKIYDLISKKER